jgi:hypothetical protein
LTNVNDGYANFTYNLVKSDSGDSSMNITYYYGADIVKELIQFEIFVQKDQNDRNYERQLIKTTINVCKMADGILGDFVARMIMDDLHKFIDFDLKCPFRRVRCDLQNFGVHCIHEFQGFYNLKNFMLTDKYVPIRMLKNNVKFSLMARVSGKIERKRGLIHLFTVKAFGEIQK